MERILIQINNISNRRERRFAEREQIKQLATIQELEDEFNELLFNEDYSYMQLYRWFRIVFYVKRLRFIERALFVLPNKDYHKNLEPIEQTSELPKIILKSHRYIRKNFIINI